MMSQQRRHDSAEAGVGELIRQMLRKESEFSTGLRENNDNLQSMAQRLAHGDGLENLLENSKLDEYRESVKRLAAQNVQHERQVKAYIQGLKQLEETCHQGGAGATVDYSKVLKEAMSNAHDEIQRNSVEVDQEQLYLKVYEQLNEPSAAGANAGGDDDDIAVMPSDNSGGNLKCPITSMLMEDPYKSKVCGHVYEHDAIKSHLKKDKQKRCPVAGCINQGMSEAQLVQDKATANRIRREKIRQKKNQELLAATQDAIEMDEEDDE
jgi:hypothetical protein